MSRLGKQPVILPAGVTATLEKGVFTMKGPKGSISRQFTEDVTVTVSGNEITLAPGRDSDFARALWGTYAAHIHNMLLGVTEGFTKKLEIEGVGYRAEIKGSSIALSVGFSHQVLLPIPDGVTAVVEKNVITVSGIDKDVVGQFAANIRATKKPEPYKGKGIRYQGEYILRKQGKRATA
jgi:large subunit ribosomal protein L6